MDVEKHWVPVFMSDQRDTKKQILDIAENFLLDRGYNGFSYKDISNALGIKNASIHYHFPKKTDLGVTIIRCAKDRFERWAQMLENRALGYAGELAEFCLLFKKYVKNKQQICLGGALETDFKTLPEEMQKEACELASAMLRWLERLLEEGRDQGAFNFPGKANAQALVVMSCLQGAIQMVRVTAPSSFDAAVEQIKLSVCN
jgi:TetR/AcrR family transcriptional regulator, transcriptional repressor for nem operon